MIYYPNIQKMTAVGVGGNEVFVKQRTDGPPQGRLTGRWRAPEAAAGSILPRTQHYQRAGFQRFNTFFLRHADQLGVFRAGIEDDAFGVEAEDVVVILLLARRIEV